MKVLIVGGTIFLGRRLVEAAIARGHEVTTFTRGLHPGDAESRVESLTGDRNGDLSALRGRHWDAVIDTCGYVPGSVKRVMDAIDRDRTRHYTFISSVSVYAKYPPAGTDERGELATITADRLEEAEGIAAGERPMARTYGEAYGALKVLCEQAAEDAMPGRVLNVRPGLIVGPHDYMDRFTYWVKRVARGGDVLAPGRPQRRVRVIDARDLAEWIVRMAEKAEGGVFNASGAEDGLTMEGMLEVSRTVSGSDARFVWVPDRMLLEHGVEPWGEMPLWIPDTDNGIFEVRNDKAVAAGLTFRSLADTIADTLRWDRTRSHDQPLRAGLIADRERELLRMFADQRRAGDAENPAH